MLAIALLMLQAATAYSRVASEQQPSSSFNGLVIVGGENITDGEYSYLSSVEQYGLTFDIPDYPEDVHGNSLNEVDDVLYSCGGKGPVNYIDWCYTLNLAHGSNSKWVQDIPLPAAISFHTGVTIGTHIWLVSYNKIYDLNTVSYDWETYPSPFAVGADHCAVSNGTHSHVLGVGTNTDEIWVNEVSGSPEEWKKVGKLFSPNYHFGCVIDGSNIVITGGEQVNGIKTQVFDTETGMTFAGPDLPAGGRYEHRMFLLDGDVAVIGGIVNNGEDSTASVVYLDSQTNAWTTYSQSMEHVRELFGFIQLFG